MREGLAQLLRQKRPDLQLLHAGSLAQALEVLQSSALVDLILLDLLLPDSQGPAAVIRLRQAYPRAAVVVVSGETSVQTVRECIEAGAMSFIPKHLDSAALLSAVEQVIKGSVVLPLDGKIDQGKGNSFGDKANSFGDKPNSFRDKANRSVDKANPSTELEELILSLRLNGRRLQILRLLVQGYATRRIAEELSLSESTIKSHLGLIYRSLGVNSRTGAVFAVSRLGLDLNDPRLDG